MERNPRTRSLLPSIEPGVDLPNDTRHHPKSGSVPHTRPRTSVLLERLVERHAPCRRLSCRTRLGRTAHSSQRSTPVHPTSPAGTDRSNRRSTVHFPPKADGPGGCRGGATVSWHVRPFGGAARL